MPAKKKLDIDSLSFEDAMQELEALVQRLETGDLALEESLALFERGQRLAARCADLLERAELRISQLSANGSEEAGGEDGAED